MKLINNILALLFPMRETAQYIEQLAAIDIVKKYQLQHHDTCVSLSSFHDPIIRACIHEIKFHNNEKGALLLAHLLVHWSERHVKSPTLLLPIPLSPLRYRTRGYNQVTRIAQRAVQESPYLKLMPNIFRRVHDTPPQTTLNRKERTANMKGAFAIRSAYAKTQIKNAHVVLLDDVYTTGATMHAAKKVLLNCNPASITCVALAH